MEDIVILIPTYNPDVELMRNFIVTLTKKFKKIVVVNEGSKSEFDDFFEELRSLDIVILKHNVNIGKGEAIKTGFAYILENYPNVLGTITADCDGQHTVSAIEDCIKALRKSPHSLIVGCRDFSGNNIPLRSKFGNQLTKFIFMAFVGITIADTQSGLRGFGLNLMRTFLNTSGYRYEYETNMLLDCKTHNIKIIEVPIQTIYIKNNATSHFNPIKDSLIIYKQFIKYALAAFSSFIIDILLFSLFIKIIPLEDNIMISTMIARIISSTYNFFTNSKLVFKKNNRSSILKYLFLVVIQMFISGASVRFLTNHLMLNTTVIKIIIDAIIFVANFIIQREWIFKSKKVKKKE